MKLQDQIVRTYKDAYPHHTLNDIAEQTGIQVTRVFRLLNGYEMKISEYEAFQYALEKKSFHSLHFLKTAKRCLELLSEESLKNLNNEMLLKLSIKKQMKLFSQVENFNNLLA